MQGFPWAERGDPIHSVPVMVKMEENVETGPMDQHGPACGSSEVECGLLKVCPSTSNPA